MNQFKISNFINLVNQILRIILIKELQENVLIKYTTLNKQNDVVSNTPYVLSMAFSKHTIKYSINKIQRFRDLQSIIVDIKKSLIKLMRLLNAL